MSEKQQELYQNYLELTDEKRFLVQIFALFYEPIGAEKARSCWVSATTQQDSFDRIDAPDLKSFKVCYRSLLDLQLLVEKRSYGACCHELLVDLAVRDAVRMGTFDPIVWAIAQRFPIKERFAGGPLFFRNESQFMREVRIALYQEDLDAARNLFDHIGEVYWQSNLTLEEALREVLSNPLDIDWLDSLSDEVFSIGLIAILRDSVKRSVSADSVFELLEDYCKNGRVGPKLHLLYIEQLWLRGRLQEAAHHLSTVSVTRELTAQYEALQGAIAFITGHTNTALKHYRASLRAVGKSQRKQTHWLEQPASILFFFSLLSDGRTDSLKELETFVLLIQKQPKHWLKRTTPLLFALVQQQQSKHTAAAERFCHYIVKSADLATILEIYCLHWLQVEEVADWMALQLPWLCQQTMQSGYQWMALETAELLAHYQPESPFKKRAKNLRTTVHSVALIDAVERKESWERSLDALTALVSPAVEQTPEPSLESTYRLIWRLRFHSLDNWLLIPVEQKLSTKGGWTKGKKLTPKKLHVSYAQPDYLSEQDKEVCRKIESQYSGRFGSSRLTPTYFFGIEALVALVGHPYVYWEDEPEVKVDIVAGEPELVVKKLEGERLQLSLSPQITRRDVMVVQETPTRLKVISVSEQHKRIAEILGAANQLIVPAKAEERVLKAIASIATLVTVQSDIGGGTEAEEVLSNAVPHIHLLPAGEGLKVSVLMHPFAEGGAYYAPGEGGETVIAVVDGKRLQTTRELSAEVKNAEQVSARCPVLLHYVPEEGEWIIDDPTDCLELLLQLQQLGDEIVIEWPEGEAFKIPKQVSSSDFQFNVRRKKDWFSVSGDIKVSDNQVLDLQQLMKLLDKTSGQFIPLENGEFLALTDEFRQRLQTLSRLSQRRGKALKIDGLAAIALNDIFTELEAESAQVDVDQAWQNHIQQIRAARSIRPKVPKTLNASLRKYQKEGFVWLARLARWGVGACLADDMGLGKTLQGLAILLDRAAEGPALVVAPTSVCMNWQSEAKKFAPSLQVHRLGEGIRENRQTLLDSLSANDLLICSYGLLQQEEVSKRLAKIGWNTIVLDEAQAIKNPATKRSRAVMSLQGNFKIIMTGTPVENHLVELWNLFRFINLGLLGSLESFKRRFANPIERDPGKPASASAREALRRLISPFILRRTKDQVLKELPSRTEITLSMDLSDEESTFYEALRREAIEKLSGSKKKSGQRHLQVLAEIMKLRRACCNPNLVRPDLAIPSTKLERFSALVLEMLDNGHKALVFSQFVDHLKILCDYLDEQQIAYQYLDGSTSTKKRKQSIDAFQSGQGDIFLISLKAGGSGLNLTAADYVIHMDPWWNPAVEDQASDRAHRIGQQRPVTIYRLVAKGTIEEKIVGLHKTKRDLADSLLEGADTSGRISTDELLALIQK